MKPLRSNDVLFDALEKSEHGVERRPHLMRDGSSNEFVELVLKLNLLETDRLS